MGFKSAFKGLHEFRINRYRYNRVRLQYFCSLLTLRYLSEITHIRAARVQPLDLPNHPLLTPSYITRFSDYDAANMLLKTSTSKPIRELLRGVQAPWHNENSTNRFRHPPPTCQKHTNLAQLCKQQNLLASVTQHVVSTAIFRGVTPCSLADRQCTRFRRKMLPPASGNNWCDRTVSPLLHNFVYSENEGSISSEKYLPNFTALL